MIDFFKNSSFIRMICNRINTMSPGKVGLLTILAYAVGMPVLFGLMLTTLVFIMLGLMYIITTCMILPYGLVVGIAGLLLHIWVWNNISETTFSRLITQQSIKLWSIAAIIGIAVFALFPMGRHLLSESQTMSYNQNIDLKMLVGIGVYAVGWLIIAIQKVPRLFARLPKAYANVKRSVESTGTGSIQRCAEMNKVKN